MIDFLTSNHGVFKHSKRQCRHVDLSLSMPVLSKLSPSLFLQIRQLISRIFLGPGHGIVYTSLKAAGGIPKGIPRDKRQKIIANAMAEVRA